MLRCKPGDLAMITDRKNYGRLCMVVRRADGRNWHACEWVIEAMQTLVADLGQTIRSGERCFARDAIPIRDEDGPDEMLAIAGKPNQHQEAEAAW